MKDFQIYLCGGMGKFGRDNFEDSNGWRKYIKRALQSYEYNHDKIKVINPNDYFNFIDEPPKYKTPAETMRFDLYKLRQSSLVIVNFNDPYSLGSMAEIAIAYDRGIPIIGLNKKVQELHPWQICMCERIFEDIIEMLEYVKEFYIL